MEKMSVISRRRKCAIVALCIGAGVIFVLPPMLREPGILKPNEKAQTSARALRYDEKRNLIPSTALPSQDMRASLREALEPGTPGTRRLDLLRAASSDLSENEADALLLELLETPLQSDEAWHSSYVHLICNILQQVPETHGRFASALAAMAANRELPEVHRDYAFQHLRILWHRTRDLSQQPEGVAEHHNRIEETFRELLVTRPETSSQSLLGLHEIRHPDGTHAVDDAEITQIARQMLGHGSTHGQNALPARMTAIRILAERGIQSEMPQLRHIAADPAEHGLVRASAIAALSHLVSPLRDDDVRFLQSLSATHPVVQGAIQHALAE